jgi:hypothetical protein
MPEYNKDGYVFVAPSENKLKKYDVYKDDKKLASFGAIHPNGTPYDQYEDKAGGYYSKYDHHDKKRRALYRQRHAKDMNNFESPGWFAARFLWT